MSGISIRSYGYTRQNSERRAPLQRTLVVIAALCLLGGDPVEPACRRQAASGDMATARVKRVLSCGNALPQANGTPVCDPACRSGLNHAGSQTGARARRDWPVPGNGTAKPPKATPKPVDSQPQARGLGSALLCSSCVPLVLLLFFPGFPVGPLVGRPSLHWARALL